MTQRDMLDRLATNADELHRLLDRYESGGAQVRADAAHRIARLFADRAGIQQAAYGAFVGSSAAATMVGFLASDAAAHSHSCAQEWRLRAEDHQREADRIEAQAASVFGWTSGAGTREDVTALADNVRTLRPGHRA